MFTSRLNEKVEATADTQTTTAKRLQTCQTFELYLTVSDWAILNDAATPQRLKIACLVRRALGLGLFWPDASTSSRWACILQLASQTDVGVKGWAQLNVLGQVKRHLRGARTKTPYHLQHLENPLTARCRCLMRSTRTRTRSVGGGELGEPAQLRLRTPAGPINGKATTRLSPTRTPA